MMTSNDERPVGVFDSGVGGLTVVSEVIKTMPNENIIYFGDTARVPYGSKSRETVTKYARQIMNFLIHRNVKAVIVACNTVSSNSYDALKEEFNLPIIEVVRPGVSLVIADPGITRVGVIGTERTITSGAYEKLLKQNNPDIEVFSKACPLFVPLAEEGITGGDIARLTAQMYLKPLMDSGVQALILGCTHYPLLKRCIEEVMPGVKIIDPAVAAALSMKRYLTENGMQKSTVKGEYEFYCSDNTEKFSVTSGLVLGDRYRATVVDIDG